MIKIVVTAGICLAGACGAIVYYINKRIDSWYLSNIETIDKELSLEDVVQYFRTLNLNNNKSCPFVCKGDSNEFRQFVDGKPFPAQKEGYDTLFVAVYEEEDRTLSHFKVIYSKGLDQDLIDLFKDSNLVVLG